MLSLCVQASFALPEQDHAHISQTLYTDIMRRSIPRPALHYLLFGTGLTYWVPVAPCRSAWQAPP